MPACVSSSRGEVDKGHHIKVLSVGKVVISNTIEHFVIADFLVFYSLIIYV